MLPFGTITYIIDYLYMIVMNVFGESDADHFFKRVVIYAGFAHMKLFLQEMHRNTCTGWHKGSHKKMHTFHMKSMILGSCCCSLIILVFILCISAVVFI